MSDSHWLHLLTRIASDLPHDYDAEFFPTFQREAPTDLETNLPDFPMSAKLWERVAGEQAYIGIRVTHPVNDVAQMAVRLASAAVERRICPVILTSLASSGFETYGFRVERLPVGPAEMRAAFEADLVAFWGLALVINAEDILALG
jgi:hypothetical protein